MNASLIPDELQHDLRLFAKQLARKHAGTFANDPALKARCGRLLRSLLPPRQALGRPPLDSVTRAIALLREYHKEFPTESRAQLWARIYRQVIPDFEMLRPFQRAEEQQRLRDRVRGRRNQQRRRRRAAAKVAPPLSPAK